MIIIVSKSIPPEHSGSGKRMYNLFLYLRREGYEVKYITNTPHRENEDVIVLKKHRYENHLGKLNPIVVFLHTFIKLTFRYLSGCFKSNIKVKTVWLVSANPMTSAAGIFFYLRGYRIITQNILMNSDDPVHCSPGLLKFNYRLKMLQYRFSDIVTCISPALYYLSRTCHPRCTMIPNPVEIPVIKVLPKAGKKSNILVVGRLCYRKGTDIVFKVINLIHKDDPDVHVSFVGPYEDMDKKLKLLYESSQNINKMNVHFAGYQIDTRPWYMKADIFLMPSRREGFGTGFIEAMAYGIPVVAKKLEGITDYIFYNGYPAVIDSEDPNEYTSIIFKLMNDDGYYHSLVKELRRNVKRFDRAKIYKQYLNLLEGR